MLDTPIFCHFSERKLNTCQVNVECRRNIKQYLALKSTKKGTALKCKIRKNGYVSWGLPPKKLLSILSQLRIVIAFRYQVFLLENYWPWQESFSQGGIEDFVAKNGGEEKKLEGARNAHFWG